MEEVDEQPTPTTLTLQQNKKNTKAQQDGDFEYITNE